MPLPLCPRGHRRYPRAADGVRGRERARRSGREARRVSTARPTTRASRTGSSRSGPGGRCRGRRTVRAAVLVRLRRLRGVRARRGGCVAVLRLRRVPVLRLRRVARSGRGRHAARSRSVPGAGCVLRARCTLRARTGGTLRARSGSAGRCVTGCTGCTGCAAGRSRRRARGAPGAGAVGDGRGHAESAEEQRRGGRRADPHATQRASTAVGSGDGLVVSFVLHGVPSVSVSPDRAGPATRTTVELESEAGLKHRCPPASSMLLAGSAHLPCPP